MSQYLRRFAHSCLEIFPKIWHTFKCYENTWFTLAWKLAIAPQNDGLRSKIPKMIPASLAEPRLYNLDTDPGEQNDVAAQHPDAVKRLKGFIEKMNADLGISLGRGPGVRPCGKVANPKPLLMRDAKEYD
jgi:hypothetical protein